MKIALAQINTTIGDFDGTIQKIGDFVARAKKEKADLIAFPELALTGYPPRDLLERPRFVDQNLKALDKIAELSSGIRIVVGFVDRNRGGAGRALFNAAALCEDEKVAAVYPKNLLPNYDVFDEARYFEPGSKAGLWKIGDQAVGISICEDAWNDKLFWEKRLYARDPIEEQVSQGARCLLNISASPFSLGKPKLRRDLFQALALKYGVPVFYVNLVGGNDDLVFDGRSFVVNDRGETVAEAAAYEEELLVVDCETDLKRPRDPVPLIGDVEAITRTLELGVRDYVRKCGFKKVVLGLSGGIDSSLTAVVAVKALGSDNVLGVIMPSPYSSPESARDAEILAKNLGIAVKKYPIGTMYEGYRHLFGRTPKTDPDLADENIQARIRGNILMTLSNREGPLVLSTGNKSELSVGYCTLYGDMSGGLAVLSDLPKTTIYEVARFYQKEKGPIPEEVFTKPPTAELKPNQKDQDTLPPYEILDAILKAYVEEHRSSEEIIKMGFEPKTVESIVRRVDRNEYKRRQAAPGIKITSKAFGIGRRYPIARKIEG